MPKMYDVDPDFDVMIETENMDPEEIENSKVFLVRVLVDASGSMCDYDTSGVMEKSLKSLSDAVEHSKECDEILLARTTFSDDVVRHGYQKASLFPTDYETRGMTSLYDAIVDAKNDLFVGDGTGYLEKQQKAGTKARGVVVIFTDGFDNDSFSSKSDAVAAIKLMKQKEISVALIAFGDEAKGIAQELGIPEKDVLETDASESALRRAMALVSKSSIHASKLTDGGSDDGFWQV